MVATVNLDDFRKTHPDQFKAIPRDYEPVRALNALLDSLGPRAGNAEVEIGYTLPINLFDFFRPSGKGGWQFEERRLDFYLDMIRRTPRPVVVYLLGNHFSAQNALTRELAADRRNLMLKPDGTPPTSHYFSTEVLPFTLSVDPEIPVNRFRFAAIERILSALRPLDASLPGRIAAVTLGGETHHLFDDLKGGTGKFSGAEYTDYSPQSIAEFRLWLRSRHADLASLNRVLGTPFRSWEEVVPPGRDIRRQALKGFWEHMDANAGGRLPVFGWINPASGVRSIEVFLDEQSQGQAQLGLNRMDVYEAKPAMATPNSGFRFDMDMAPVSPGIHRLKLVAQMADGKRQLLVERDIVRMGADQSRPGLALWDRIKSWARRGTERLAPFRGEFWLDQPVDLQDVYVNPYAQEWQAFRNAQVRRHLEQLFRVAAATGFDRSRLYSHQLLPALNGGWNDALFAAGQSFDEKMPYQPGITLYGGLTVSEAAVEMAYGRPYGVPEMHPQQFKRPGEALAALRFQQQHCASFVSPYFMDARPAALRGASDGHDAMLLEEGNRKMGSEGFLAAIREMAKPGPRTAPNAAIPLNSR